ncbi:MAG: hypothetical protein K0Q95_2035 [Bacteroidota bacterium]|jgi:hypothetical protein|nr:hypothetical protein [Bacteroidota bacterium]
MTYSATNNESIRIYESVFEKNSYRLGEIQSPLERGRGVFFHGFEFVLNESIGFKKPQIHYGLR